MHYNYGTMSLNRLFRNSRIAGAKKAVVTVAAVAGVAGFVVMTKMVDANGKVINPTPSTSQSPNTTNNGGASGFASNNPVLKPPSSSSGVSGGVSYNPENCVKNPSVENCSDNSITQKDWDEFLPPNGLVVRDGRGNVIFKKCRSLTEGAAAAKAEMDPEKARYDRFMTAMNINTNGGYRHRGDDDGGGNYQCRVQPSSPEPKAEPCPTLKNFTDLRDYYRQQYYHMSNELQNRAKNEYDCVGVRDTVLAAADPNWKNDRGPASAKKSADAAFENRGVR